MFRFDPAPKFLLAEDDGLPKLKDFPAAIGGSGENAARIAQRLPQLLDEVVVVFVRADPKPDDIAVFLRNSAKVISDSY